MTIGHGRLPAGWYRDPVGMHVARYWDGAHWTREAKDVWDGEGELQSLIDVWRTESDAATADDDGRIIDIREVVASTADVGDSLGAGSQPMPGAVRGRAVNGGATRTLAPVTGAAVVHELGERNGAPDGFMGSIEPVVPPLASGHRIERTRSLATMARAGRIGRVVAAVGIFVADVALYLRSR